MTSDLISNPSTEADYYCNLIIKTSNDIAKDIGVSYSELWIGIMFLVIAMIGYYVIVSYGSLYSKYRTLFKWMFWIGIIFIGVLIFVFMSIVSTLYVNP